MEDIVNKRTQEVISQKEIIEEKNKDITASIRYAQRIQNVILPSLSSFYSSFEDHFVLFKPRDIVSGDFYWLEVVDGKTYFAVVDCTGHGVPGALVSVVGANSLNRCLIEFGLRKPSEILDKLSELVTETFDKTDSEVKDGMDIALCCLDNENGILEYAGANNPLWLLKNATDSIGKDLIPDLDKHQLIEIKPNKQPIGSYFKVEPFTNHRIEVDKGDIIYLFSDGFADQFGGLHQEIRNKGGKKFKYAKLKELIFETQHLSMADQIDVFNARFEEWKGELDQVDDVCIVGIQL
jgi:serine phosphatase RsbU (regulator of sigma subunit)